MPILTLNDVSLAYGHQPLLDKVNFQVDRGERVCLIGRNGTGKSTLFRVLSNTAAPDDGEIWRKDPLKISYLEQEVPGDETHTIYEVVAAGLGELGELLAAYHNTVHHVAECRTGAMDTLGDLQHRIEVIDGWNVGQKVDSVLSRLSLPADKPIADCSGGIRRRVMLAQALVNEPDLLLLDEPTNHMDIAAITWLEEFLLGFKGALIFITHDRTFLKHLATRIIELDRGILTSFPGNYEYYLNKKEELLQIETRANAKFDKKLAEYEVWVRKGIKARRTRNEGRVRELQAMRKLHSQRISAQGSASFKMDSGDQSGKRVADLRDISFYYADHCVIRNLSTRVMRGDRIGIVGPNGSGKSTLLKLILGELQPDSGQVIMGTHLQTAYFDQQRDQLNPDKTVRDNISDGNDYIPVKGRSRHVVSYLKDFLFPPDRIDSPVKSLSGGERNRLLLAQIFAQPANMLVLDEPTNDLDVDTLELLEDLLGDYDGTLLLVSHDRTFLDNVVTSTLVFEGDGQVGEYVGGYEDWIRQRRKPGQYSGNRAEKNPGMSPQSKNQNLPVGKKKTLGYKEKHELGALPGKIETLEQEQKQLTQAVGQAGFYQQDSDSINHTLARLKQLDTDLEKTYARWEELDDKTA
ncbi:MAG TPA: ATP-binding cassette domain-containing protein [Acidiferrobacteraceae bacterium]|nr:ATP-binding cassette domain-containing protein [Acidiferrobacteraceae bacterium]